MVDRLWHLTVFTRVVITTAYLAQTGVQVAVTESQSVDADFLLPLYIAVFASEAGGRLDVSVTTACG